MSTVKYHRNNNNQIRPCSASQKPCPFPIVDLNDPAVRKEIEKQTVARTGGVNVSAFETAYVSEFKKFVDTNMADYQKLLSIPPQNRPVLLRDATTSADVIKNFQNLKNLLVKDLGVSNPQFTVSRNNRDGSDLEETSTGVSVELKLGAATDANIGLNAMGKILPYETMSTLPWGEDRVKWRGMFDGSEESIKHITVEHDKKLQVFAGKVNESKGKLLPTAAQKQLNAYFAGITSTDDVDKARNVQRYSLTGAGWVNSTRKADSMKNDWVSDGAVFNPSNGRVSIFFVSPSLGQRFKAVYNYKNSYRKPVDGGVIKAQAKLGLGSPSFNCWFQPVKPTK